MKFKKSNISKGKMTQRKTKDLVTKLTKDGERRRHTHKHIEIVKELSSTLNHSQLTKLTSPLKQ